MVVCRRFRPGCQKVRGGRVAAKAGVV